MVYLKNGLVLAIMVTTLHSYQSDTLLWMFWRMILIIDSLVSNLQFFIWNQNVELVIIVVLNIIKFRDYNYIFCLLGISTICTPF